MLWKIEGADTETGEDRRIWLEAISKEAATTMASHHNMMVSSVEEHHQEIKVVSHMPSGPIEVELSRYQLRSLRVSEFRIAVGVFLGLLLWSIFGVILVIAFWSVVIAALAGAA